MLMQLFFGSLMILLTTTVHGAFVSTGISHLRRRYGEDRRPTAYWRATSVLSLFVLWLFLAMVVEVWMWAALYRLLGAIGSLEEALYFSTVTFTTLGYGDVVLEKQWRLLAAFEAANGLFLFGWSTALVFAVVQGVYGKGE